MRHGAKNPTSRKAGPFLQYLEFSDGSETLDEMVVALSSSLPSDRVSQKHHEELLTGILEHMGAHKMHTRYPQLRSVARDDSDAFLQRMWAKESTKDSDRAAFVISHRKALSMFMDTSVALRVLSNGGDKPGPGALTELFRCRVGQSLFRAEAMDASFLEFQATVAQRLHDAEMEHFAEDVVASFRGAMIQITKQLRASGHKPWEKKNEYPFFNT